MHSNLSECRNRPIVALYVNEANEEISGLCFKREQFTGGRRASNRAYAFGFVVARRAHPYFRINRIGRSAI
jgi:hypothetical protein